MVWVRIAEAWEAGLLAREAHEAHRIENISTISCMGLGIAVDRSWCMFTKGVR